MRLLGHLLLAASLPAVFGAIWLPDYRWQSAATSLVLLLVGASVLGQTDKTTDWEDS